MDPASDLFGYLLRLGDDRLVLGHRLSEWCGHGPILEEDIATANVALDLIGQATLLLKLAGQVEGLNRSEDDLTYLREAVDFRNALLVEQPNGDFGFTMVRQFLFDAFNVQLLEGLQRSKNTELAGIAAKGLKEARYHIRHSSQWVIRLGDGTDESHKRVQDALNELWRFTGELFLSDEVDKRLEQAGLIPEMAPIEKAWREIGTEVFRKATLEIPQSAFMMRGGRNGKHTEHLGHMLAEMQIVARSHPGAEW
jgi:ring-1,2-phenylacetyl-CoA epoxidase subunit PaaC